MGHKQQILSSLDCKVAFSSGLNHSNHIFDMVAMRNGYRSRNFGILKYFP